jgi:hypothetical protein
MPEAKKPPIALPWLPIQLRPGFKKHHAVFVQQFARGELDKEGQIQLYDFLVTTLCGTYDLSFREDKDGGDRATNFAEGKRFIGMELVKLSKLNLSLLKDES